MADNNREARARRIEEGFAALRAAHGGMRETDAQIRALLAEQREGLDRASKNVDEIDSALDRIEQRKASACPTCDGTDGDHQIGCDAGEEQP